MKKAPLRWHVDAIFKWCKDGPRVSIEGEYHPARPMGFFSLKNRLSLAWDVFRGRADALYWEGQ